MFDKITYKLVDLINGVYYESKDYKSIEELLNQLIFDNLITSNKSTLKINNDFEGYTLIIKVRKELQEEN